MNWGSLSILRVRLLHATMHLFTVVGIQRLERRWLRYRNVYEHGLSAVKGLVVVFYQSRLTGNSWASKKLCESLDET